MKVHSYFVGLIAGASILTMPCSVVGAPSTLQQDRFPSTNTTLVAQASTQANTQSEFDSLLKAARAESEVTFYTTVTSNVAKRLADAYSAKYGIKTSFLRLTAAPILQRYSSEADSGNVAADLILIAGGAEEFAQVGLKKGWIEPVSQANIPALQSGEFPKGFLRGPSAVVTLYVWVMAYNTNKVKGADIPKDWLDLTNPKWKGQLLISSPRFSDSFLPLYSMLLDRYGEKFFAGLRAQGMRPYAGNPPTIQALAAGEGSIAFAVVPAAVEETKEKGAPLEVSAPSYTTGAELHVILTARGKAKHPNAARLMTHYLMTSEGNKVFNSDVGMVGVHDNSSMPKEYEPPKASALERKQLIYKLLGLEQ